MSLTICIVFVAASIALAISVVLVFHPEYHDGLVRRIGLACIGFGAFLSTYGILQAGFERRPFSTIAVVVWTGIAIFLGDHFYNFIKHLWASRKKSRRVTDRNGNGNGGVSAANAQ